MCVHSVYTCVCMCTVVQICKSEENLLESVLSFYQADSGDQFQVENVFTCIVISQTLNCNFKWL